MKKYTMPTVEITAFDVEDVIMTSGGTNPIDVSNSTNAATAASDFTAAGYDVVVNVEW